MTTPAPPPGYVLLKMGDLIKEGDLIYRSFDLPIPSWKPTSLAGDRVTDATFCRPAPKEQPKKQWLNPWD